jgi:ribonuclease E
VAQISQELAAAAAGVTTENMGEKVRVHALAKALGVPSAEMIAVLDTQGFGGKKATSTLAKADVETVLTALRPAAEKKSAKKAPARKSTAKKSAAKKSAAKKGAAKKSAATKSTAKKAPAKKTAAKKTTEPESSDAPVEVTEKTPAKKAPAKKTSAKKAPAKKTSVKKAEQPEKAEKAEQPATASAAETAVAETSAAAQKPQEDSQEPAQKSAGRRSRRSRRTRSAAAPVTQAETPAEIAPQPAAAEKPQEKAEKKAQEKAEKKAQEKPQEQQEEAPRRVVRRRIIRRVGSRTAASDAELLRRRRAEQTGTPDGNGPAAKDGGKDGSKDGGNDGDKDNSQGSGRRRGRRGGSRGRGVPQDVDRKKQEQKPEQKTEPKRVNADGVEIVDEPVKLKGSTRLASKRLWRQEQNQEKSKAVTRAEFKAHREHLYREMVVRDSQRSDHPGTITQVALTEDGQLVEHFVTSETQSSIIGNIYLGRVQNVLASMEAAFVDIGTGRNAVLYASEVNWHSPHLHSKNRKIEQALKIGDQVLVQVIKDPIGHKGARLTNRISFAGRFLVYLPGGRTHGISRRLPEGERKRLKKILTDVVPEDGGTIIRTAAEGVSEEMIAEDVDRLHRRWTDIQEQEDKARNRKGSKPSTMYEEPNMLVKVIRDIFTEDINELVVDGADSWQVVRDYVHRMAPDLEDRVVKYNPDKHDGKDVFVDRKIDEQLTKALSRKVWLPSGGYLIIDPTEAMTVIDVNTGSFVGSGGNLEETVTKNNIEAAEEIVRQMRLRDMGGMIVVDFIDMVLPENRELVLRRLQENLAFDRTRHKVSEVTSLGLVQMTRKRLGTGLLDTYSTVCEACEGRGIIIHDDPVEHTDEESDRTTNDGRRDHNGRSERRQAKEQAELKQRYEKAREDAENGSEDADTGHGDGDHHQERAAEKHAAPTAEQHAAPAAEPAAEEPAEPTAGEHSSGKSEAPASRRRRRVVRRVHSAREGQDAHPESGSDELADIAAHAIAHAGEIDPEEPTGADYVADEPVTAETADEDVRTSSHRDRRGRRRVVRTTVKPEPEKKPEPEVEKETESRKSPESGGRSGQSETRGTAGKGGYAEAKAEFEASPRRRRRTRGKSRSDVPPQPEDFVVVDEPATGKGTKVADDAPRTTPVKEERSGGGDAPARGGRRGGRRRVVRRSH